MELIEELEPHIIICDIVMPVMDGVDFAEAVHKMYPQTPIIILSGYDKFEYVKQACMSGVFDYILKPSLNPDVLKNALRKAAEQLPHYTFGETNHEISYERLLERYMLGHDRELDTKALSRFFQNKNQSGNWAVTNMPKLNDYKGATNYSAQGGSTWAISSTCKNTELAEDFFKTT